MQLLRCVSPRSCPWLLQDRAQPGALGCCRLRPRIFVEGLVALGFCLLCLVGFFDWLFLTTRKRKQVSVYHIISFIMKDKPMLGFNLSLSYPKVSFRTVVRQGVEGACEGKYLNVSLSLIFGLKRQSSASYLASHLMTKADIHYWNNSRCSSLKVFCIGFHPLELQQR